MSDWGLRAVILVFLSDDKFRSHSGHMEETIRSFRRERPLLSRGDSGENPGITGSRTKLTLLAMLSPSLRGRKTRGVPRLFHPALHSVECVFVYHAIFHDEINVVRIVDQQFHVFDGVAIHQQ